MYIIPRKRVLQLGLPLIRVLSPGLVSVRVLTVPSSLRRTSALLNHTKGTKRRFNTKVHVCYCYTAHRITKVYFFELSHSLPVVICRPLRSLLSAVWSSRALLSRTHRCVSLKCRLLVHTLRFQLHLGAVPISSRIVSLLHYTTSDLRFTYMVKIYVFRI